MDLSILLAFEVVGLFSLAAVMTGVLIWGDLARPPAASTQASFPVTVFCPSSMEPKGVLLRALTRDDRTELSVLECDRFQGGSVLCDQDCLSPAVIM